MATGALDANGIWQYGEDDSETTFSGLLNKLASSTSDTVTRLEGFTGYTGTLPIANGGTGATTVNGARANLLKGSVLQVVQTAYATQATNSTTSWADTGLTATITPISASSKILVIAKQSGVAKSAGNANSGVVLGLFRGASQLIVFEGNAAITYTNVHNTIGGASVSFLDSPNTTSAVTYKTVFANTVAAAAAAVQNGSCASTITLLEIGG